MDCVVGYGRCSTTQTGNEARRCQLSGLPQIISRGLAALLVLIPWMSAQGGGLWLYEMGTPDVGTATAGMASRASDAATVFANPAGMTRLKGSQVMLGVQPMYGVNKFDTDVATYGGGDGGNAGGLFPVGSLSYMHSVSDDLKLGLSAGSYFGLGLDFDDDWAGRYYIQKEEFTTLFANAAVGYRLNHWLSVGGGVSLIHGEFEAQTNLNNVLDGGPDGRVKIKADDNDVGWNAGILVEPAPGTRVGLTYISKVDLKYKDKPSFKDAGPVLDAALQLSGLDNANTRFDFTLPNQLMLSLHQDLNQDLAVMVDLGWQNWSQFGQIGLSVDTTTAPGNPLDRSLSVDANFKDTWHIALGARYRLNPRWSVSAGFAYDSSPVDDEDRSIVLPLDRQYRYATGLMYEWNDDVTVGAAYEYMDAGSAPVDQSGNLLKGDLKGEFKDNEYSVVALSVNWKL